VPEIQVRKTKSVRSLWKNIARTRKAKKKQRGQNPAEQAHSSKLCKAGQQASSLFATLPCDEKKIRMTIITAPSHLHSLICFL